MHGQIGEAVEGLEGGLAERAALLAYHFARSEYQEKAVSYVLLAADHAVGLHARSEPTTHYEQALLMASKQGDRAGAKMIDAALHFNRTNVHHQKGEWTPAHEHLALATNLFKALDMDWDLEQARSFQNESLASVSEVPQFPGPAFETDCSCMRRALRSHEQDSQRQLC